MEISIIIPAYNEEHRIIPTLKLCHEHLESINKSYEIIVVNDGSIDDTIQILNQYKSSCKTLTIVSLKRNRGKGYAVKTGMLNAKGKFRVFMDADGSTPIGELGKLLEPLYNLETDISIGSRYIQDSEIIVSQPKYRILFSRISNKLVQKLLLPQINDPHCGFKAYTAESAHLIFRFSSVSGWSFDEDNLALARLFNFRIKEIPVKWKNDEHSKGKISHVPKEFFNLFRIKVKILILYFLLSKGK